MSHRLWAAVVTCGLALAAAPFPAPVVEAQPSSGLRYAPDPEAIAFSVREEKRLGGTSSVLAREPGSVEPLTIAYGLPVTDGGPRSLWVFPFSKNAPPRKGWMTDPVDELNQLTVLQAAPVPSHSLLSRRARLRLDQDVKADDAEVWVTRDAWHWQRYPHTNDGDALVVNLPEGGRFGLQVRSRGAAPLVGDAPQVWVVVDEYALQFEAAKKHTESARLWDRWEGPRLKAHGPIARIDAEKPDPEQMFHFGPGYSR